MFPSSAATDTAIHVTVMIKMEGAYSHQHVTEYSPASLLSWRLAAFLDLEPRKNEPAK